MSVVITYLLLGIITSFVVNYKLKAALQFIDDVNFQQACSDSIQRIATSIIVGMLWIISVPMILISK